MHAHALHLVGAAPRTVAGVAGLIVSRQDAGKGLVHGRGHVLRGGGSASVRLGEPAPSRRCQCLRVTHHHARAHKDVVVRVGRAQEDGALGRGAPKILGAARGGVAVQRANEVHGGHGGHARAEHNAHRVEADAARIREQRTGRIVLGQEDFDRAVLVNGNDVVGRDAVNVARVRLRKVPGSNRHTVLVVKPAANGHKGIRVRVRVLRHHFGAVCGHGDSHQHAIRIVIKGLGVEAGAARRSLATVFAFFYGEVPDLFEERAEVHWKVASRVLDPLALGQVQPVADDDVRVVVVVEIAHGCHARGVHRRAHASRPQKGLGHRRALHVTVLHPHAARLHLSAERHTALVVVFAVLRAALVRGV